MERNNIVREKNQALIYDIRSFPRNDDFDTSDLFRLFYEQGILFWDSSNGGHKPEFINIEVDKVKVLDMAQMNKEEIDEYIKKIKE